MVKNKKLKLYKMDFNISFDYTKEDLELVDKIISILNKPEEESTESYEEEEEVITDGESGDSVGEEPEVYCRAN